MQQESETALCSVYVTVNEKCVISGSWLSIFANPLKEREDLRIIFQLI